MGFYEGIELFALTVETGSFASAARRVGMTPSAVSRRIALLESEVGLPLLARTTRALSLTHDGRAFHERCVRILEEVGEAKRLALRAKQSPSGTVRVDAPIALGRSAIAPRIPELLRKYPELAVDLTVRDQFVDPFVEGVDVLVRIGSIGDGALIARRLGQSRLVTCAAPKYLARRGAPRTLDDLARHDCIGYLREGRPATWLFPEDDGVRSIDPVGRYHSNDAFSIVCAGIAGQGIISVFDFLVEDAIRSGTLVPVLPDVRTPVWPIHALYPKNRHLVPKVRVFLDFVTRILAPRR